MKYYALFFTLFFTVITHAQKTTDSLSANSKPEKITRVKGVVINGSNDKPLESVNIVNLDLVKGTTTNSNGEFEIFARVNDTIHFSYLGFKSVKVKVTNDWIAFGNNTIILTELALALEQVVINQFRLTGNLEVDIKQVPINNSYRYSISGLPSTGYEASRSAATKILGALFNPVDAVYGLFSKKKKELNKLRKMKEDDEIRNILASRFNREMLMVLLQVDRVDLDEIVRKCNYSNQFIQTANDLQILDAISECYEEYKVLNRNKN